ncbi:MAG TPA: SgcJ/EcaC family oxidoreductase [Burkholderiales bacterium]|nr:SgcJ/EcaC family oxidoreductase [Burkholderiales bacterium]
MKRRLYSMLLLFLFVAAPAAWAGPKDEVAAATARWAVAFTDDNPDKILALYDKNAVLWGTLSPKRRDDPEAIRDYFVKAFAALPEHKVSFGDQLIRVYGNTAINTGYYTFSYVKDGEAKSLPARYSFTYVKKGKKWLIVDHHSSAMPAPLK